MRYTCIPKHINTYAYMCVYTHMYMYIHTCMYVYIMHVYIYVYSYIHIPTMEYYSVLRKEVLPFAMTWMDLPDHWIK